MLLLVNLMCSAKQQQLTSYTQVNPIIYIQQNIIDTCAEVHKHPIFKA